MKARKLCLLLILPSLVHTFSPPQIISESTIQSDDVIGDFIELNEGEDISLQCTHSQGEDIEFVLPDLSEYKLFDPSDYALRRQGGGGEWSDTLLIKNAKVTDTGLYACVVRSEHSLAHHVYVFIKGPKLFIPLNAGGFSVDPYNYAVPCKTSRNVPRTSIKLNVNGEDWKIASKKYDPRFGFNITGKTAEDHKLSSQLMFICTFTDTNETLEFLIGPRAGNINPKVDVEWGEISPWAHVGGDMAVECILKLNLKDEKYKHKINITCPRCDNKEAVQSLTRARGARGMSHSISIHEVVNEDRGVYKCQWYYDGKLEKVIEKTLEVSPKKGQIKINEVSSQEITIRNNQSFSLQVNMTAYPLNLPGFTAKWMRHYIKPPKDAPITETIITDDRHNQESKRFENQVSETLTVKDAKTNSSGLYVLSIEILDTVKTVEFKVVVLSDELKPKIQITTPHSYALFNQSYYPPNSQIGILCSAESLPLPYYVRLSYRVVNGGWHHVDPVSMVYLNGTYESAIQWDTVLKQTIDVKCEASTGSNKLELVRIKVADGAPKVSHVITKSSSATPLEDEKDTYEGDSVLLRCQYPKDTDMTAEWKFNGNDIPASKINVTETDVSTILNANLKEISSSQSGDYSCVLNSNNEEKVLQLKINVLKTLKPYHTDSDSETPIQLEYGKVGYLHCYLEGLPKPQIYWFKDGREYTQGVLEEQNRTLHITRVALEDKGKFTCRAENRAGYAEASFHTTVAGGPKKLGSGWISFMIVVLLLLCCCVVAFAFVVWKQRKTNKEQNRALEVLYEQLMRETSGPPPSSKQPLDQRVSDLPYNREFELERDMMEIGNRLGAGQFGIVWKGVLKKNRVSDECVEEDRLEVAVKGPLNGKNATHQKMLADELKIMCAIGKHPNVLALVGAVTKNMKNGELFVVVELCENGNLKDFLLARKGKFIDELRPPEVKEGDYVMPDSAKRSRYANELDTQWAEDAEKDRLLVDSSSLTTSDLLSFAMQVANGMDYLSSIPCIHRDLAARNVLITSNNVCRIADFGMARNENKNYYKLRKSKNVPVPYRWMSIEAIEQGLFTVESDVWSFGILLYEMFTLSGMPYPTIANEDLLDKLKNGYRNPKPNYCHEEVYQLMTQCWQDDNLKRPSFNNCVHLLKRHLELSSPQLLERVEKEIMKDVSRQNSLSKWISQDVDYREQARNALARQEASRTANRENVYLRSF